MRILFVHEIRGFFGGVEQNVVDAATGLGARGHVCALAYGRESGRETARFDAAFSERFACRELADEASPGAGRLEVAIAAFAPELIYVHKVPAIAPVLAARGRIPVARMVHDHDLVCPRRHKYMLFSGQVCTRPQGLACFADGAFVERAPGAPLGFRWVDIQARLAELPAHDAVDRMLVASRYMRDELVANGVDPARIEVVPPAVELRAAAPEPVGTAPRLLYVGQLVRGKGVDLLIRALALCARPITLTIVGSGNARPALEALVRSLKLDERVTFAGWASRDELAVAYRDARVVVVPSRWPEPFGMVGVEAMARGRPVVASNVGGIPDWLDHGVTGLVAPPQDTLALARALERVALEPDLAETLGARARAAWERRFTMPHLIDRLESALEGVRA